MFKPRVAPQGQAPHERSRLGVADLDGHEDGREGREGHTPCEPPQAA